MSALQAARSLRAGVLDVLGRAAVDVMPISDGGDGLIEALAAANGGRLVVVRVRGPLGETRSAAFLLQGRRAVVEMARASGLALLGKRRDPLGATSYGTGELVAAALKRGATEIAVGLGGSATNDGGAGMAQALGARLLDADGRDLAPGAAALLRLERVVWKRPRLGRVLAVSDVTNPLLGPRGSARVYGPQKGATPAQVRLLERALTRWAKVLKRDLGVEVARRPGAGAAGGLGAGLLAFLGAKVVPGAAWVLRETRAEGRLEGAVAALTGEGRLDETSFYGKAPVEFARLARSKEVPVAAVCASLDAEVGPRLKKAGLQATAFIEAGASPADSHKRAAEWARRAAALAIRKLLLAGLAVGLLSVPARCAGTTEIDRLYFQRHIGSNLEASLGLLEAELAKTPDAPELLWRQGRSLVRLGERKEKKKERLAAFERAESVLSRAVALAPKDAEAHFFLGIAMGRRGQTRGILNSLFLIGPMRREMRTVLELDPKHGGAHHVLGEMLRQIPGFAGGDKKGAVRELEEAVRLDPDFTAHYVALAEAYLAVKEKDKAAAALKRAFEVKTPADPGEHDENLADARGLLKKLGVE